MEFWLDHSHACFGEELDAHVAAGDLPHMRTDLVTHALSMAVARRQPDGVVIHHSDQGSQYVSYDFEKACRKAGIVRSMGSVGDCFDNAVAEWFFATLECELLDRYPFRDRYEARIKIHNYIERFYNRKRRHSTSGNVSPEVFERRWRESRRVGDAA